MIFTNILRMTKEKKISMSELERRAGLAKGTISKWKTSSPTIENLKVVAKVLETTVDELIKGETE